MFIYLAYTIVAGMGSGFIASANKTIGCDVLNEHISGLVCRSSLAAFRLAADKANKDVLFQFHNKTYKETIYPEGLGIKLIIEP